MFRFPYHFSTIYSASTNPIVPGVGEGQGTGRAGNFVAKPMKSQVQLICFIFLCTYVVPVPTIFRQGGVGQGIL